MLVQSLLGHKSYATGTSPAPCARYLQSGELLRLDVLRVARKSAFIPQRSTFSV